MDKSRKLIRVEWTIRFISVIIIFIGTYWLWAWLSGAAVQNSSYGTESGRIMMKTNMSFALLLMGIIILLKGLPGNAKILNLISGLLALIVFIIGSLTLIENIFNIDLRIDQMLASEPLGASGTLSPNRFSLPGSLSLTVLGAGFLFLTSGKRKAATIMGLAVFIINLIPASGYLLNIGLFYSNPRITAIAWPAVLAIMLSGLGLVFVKPGKVIKDLITKDNPGDILIRRLLPAIFLIPLLTGFIIIHGEKLVYYDQTTSTGIQVVLLIVLFTLMSFRIRKIVNRINASRKYSEKSLRESEKKYRLIFETANEGIWITDANRKIILINHRMSEMLGYPVEEILGKTGSEFLFSDQEENLKETFEMLKSGIKISREFKLKRKDGTMLWVISHASPVIDENGQHIKTVSMLTDITIRKHAENKLQEAQDKLNLALESGNIGVWEWDLKTNELIWDERMEKMFGLQPGTFENSYKAFLNLVHEEDLAHIQKALNETFNEGKPYVNIYRTKPVNGKIKYITSKAVANKFEEGKPLGLIGVCFDVTWVQEETEQTIIKLNEELLRSNKELESFAYIASHDLLEPLRMVSCFTQLLSQEYSANLDDKARDYIYFAVEGSNRMSELLNGLLTYSRIHSKAKNYAQVDIAHVVDNVTKNLALKIKERHAKIDFVDMPVILADETQMVQLFQNLIANAIKFSPDDPRIIITSELNGMEYWFSIKDHGLGIEPQYFERIFQIFQRLQSREKYDGTGIGLAICKRIVERHGGKIWLESKPNKGSTFFFTIPVMN